MARRLIGTQEQTQQPQEPGRLLGGALPIIGGTLGSILGGVTGGVAGLPTGPGALATGAGGAIAGGAAGTAGGAVLENTIEKLLSDLGRRQAVDPGKQLREAAGDVGASVATDVATAGLGKLLRPLGGLFRSGLPKTLISASLPETASVGRQFAKKAARGTGEEISDLVLEGGFKGSPKAIINQADEAFDIAKGNIDEILEGPGKNVVVNLSEFVDKAKNKVLKSISGEGASKSVQSVVDDFSARPLEGRTISDTFNLADIINIRENADFIGKGKAGTDVSSVARKFNVELANEIRTELQDKFPNLAKLITSKQSARRVAEAAANAARKPPISRGDVIPLIIGSGIGGGSAFLGSGGDPIQGLIGGAAGAGAARLPFQPGFSTRAAQALPRVPGIGNLLNQLLLRPTTQAVGQNITEQEIERRVNQ